MNKLIIFKILRFKTYEDEYGKNNEKIIPKAIPYNRLNQQGIPFYQMQ